MKKLNLSFLLLFTLTAVLFTNCSKSSGSSTTPPKTNTVAPVTAGSVSIQNFAFSPASLNLKAGGTVTWTNLDSSTHTVSDNSGAYDSGNVIFNATYSHTFATAGTYTYHCKIHSMMASATIVVTN